MTTHQIPLTSHHAPLRRPTQQRHRPAPTGSTPWGELIGRHVGMLRYARARGVVSLAVRYSTWGQRILLRLPAYSDAGPFLDGADVALDIDAGTDRESRVVRAAGVGVVVSDPSAALAETVSDPATNEPLTTIVLIPEAVSWLPQVDDIRYPPLPDGTGRMPATFAG